MRPLPLLLCSCLLSACGARTGLLSPEVELLVEEPEEIVPEFRDDPEQATADKIDLLLVIDDSGSMADKQAILARAVPDLVRRLTVPRCVDRSGAPVAGQPLESSEPCPDGSVREFSPVQDMHIGVLSTSVGAGVAGCAGTSPPRAGRLVTTNDEKGYEDFGFIAWDPEGTKDPSGERDVDDLMRRLRELVVGVGQTGCGNEAPLEAFYRFLIDPEPAAQYDEEPCPDSDRKCSVPVGNDVQLSLQRRRFLRPDSLVAVLMLSDENDCSIMAEGDAYRAATLAPLERPTAVCETDPNNPCCHPCGSAAPAGCPDPATDQNCMLGDYTPEESVSLLSCTDHKRRFGFDPLYPIERYVRGLTQPTVPGRDGQDVPNPLFSDLTGSGAPPRSPTLVFAGAIVGVPWQNLARDHQDEDQLSYMSSSELEEAGRWDMLVGDPSMDRLPGDPLMIETDAQREGIHPITGDPLQPADADDPLANPINGHEMDLSSGENNFGLGLQYSCIFDLPEPQRCGGRFCDCDLGAAVQKRPICQAPDGTYGNVQYRAKAYPGLRQLRLLRELGSRAVPASICARNVVDETRQDYGYRPAVEGILDRLRAGLQQ